MTRVLDPRRLPTGRVLAASTRQEKIGYKIREAQLQKIPYMLVVGDREAAEGTVSQKREDALACLRAATGSAGRRGRCSA